VVAGQGIDLVLGEETLPAEPVHDLHVGRIAGERAQEPPPPVIDFVLVAVREQRAQGLRRIPEPHVAVVPIASAAELLGQ